MTHFPHLCLRISPKRTYREASFRRKDRPKLTFTGAGGEEAPTRNVAAEKSTEGPRMYMKTKDEKSDIFEGPTMLMKTSHFTISPVD